MSVTDLTKIVKYNSRDVSELLQYKERSWGYVIADDQIPGVAAIEKYGSNAATAAGDVIQTESAAIAITATATTLEIVSASGDDTDGGAGAQSVIIWGVDANWNPISETVIMNGATPSSATNSVYLYVYRAKITGSGAVRNAGLITIRRSGAGATFAQIPLGYGQTMKCMFPVFAGCKMYLSHFGLEGTKTGTLTGEIALMEYQLDQGIRVRHSIVFGVGGKADKEWHDALKVFTEKTLIWIEALSISTGAIITAGFDGVIMRYEDSTP